MSSHTCDNCLLSCIDYRLQGYINNWTKTNLEEGSWDRISFAGGVKNLDIILSQIDLSKKLHQIKRVILINHEDCGAYGEEGTPQNHAEDLKDAKSALQKLYPDLAIDLYFLHLDGEFEVIS